MNWEQFKKGVGARYQFEPPACRLDDKGNELPEEHDDWLLQAISNDVVILRNTRTDHIAELGKDHIYDFRSNPGRSKGGIQHGFLVLKVQIFLQGNDLKLRPNSRPGEPVVRVRRIQAEWTPWLRVKSKGFPAEVTRTATLQYRLWSDDPAVPLMIRFASTSEGGYAQELSGPSGVADQLILESETYYVSFSHPSVQYEVSVVGFKLHR